MSQSPAEQPDVREQLIRGAAVLIDSDPAGDLSVRRLAQAGQRSTMCVYTKFGSRNALLEATYHRMREEFLADWTDGRSLGDLVLAYRRAAFSHPGRYQWLFSPAIAPLELDARLRAQTIDAILLRLIDAVGLDRHRALTVWATAHGLLIDQFARADEEWLADDAFVDAVLAPVPPPAT